MGRRQTEPTNSVTEESLEELAHAVVTAAYEERFTDLEPLRARLEALAAPLAQVSQLLQLSEEAQQIVFMARDMARTVQKALDAAAQGRTVAAQQWAYCHAYTFLTAPKGPPFEVRKHRHILTPNGAVYLPPVIR